MHGQQTYLVTDRLSSVTPTAQRIKRETNSCKQVTHDDAYRLVWERVWGGLGGGAPKRSEVSESVAHCSEPSESEPTAPPAPPPHTPAHRERRTIARGWCQCTMPP